MQGNNSFEKITRPQKLRGKPDTKRFKQKPQRRDKRAIFNNYYD